jgi:spermidine/putrescine transport system substrate-binding protein
MEKIDKTLAANPLIFPTDQTLAATHVFRALTPDEETKYNNLFQTVIGN